jgi:hypothetical protein
MTRTTECRLLDCCRGARGLVCPVGARSEGDSETICVDFRMWLELLVGTHCAATPYGSGSLAARSASARGPAQPKTRTAARLAAVVAARPADHSARRRDARRHSSFHRSQRRPGAVIARPSSAKTTEHLGQYRRRPSELRLVLSTSSVSGGCAAGHVRHSSIRRSGESWPTARWSSSNVMMVILSRSPSSVCLIISTRTGHGAVVFQLEKAIGMIKGALAHERVASGGRSAPRVYFRRSDALDGSPHNCRCCSEKPIASSLVTNVRPIVGAPSTRTST